MASTGTCEVYLYESRIAFKGPVHRNEMKSKTNLSQNIDWSIFWLLLPKFGVILVAVAPFQKYVKPVQKLVLISCNDVHYIPL